jgi:SAM-dependent methyltransferase
MTTSDGEAPAAERDAHDWDAPYRGEAPPPWDIGRPQPTLVALADEGVFTGRVLDAGCGTGENSLMLAGHGVTAHGVDLSPTAIDIARHKATERGVEATFAACDILTSAIGDRYDGAIDSGLFHSFADEGRARYVDVLHAAIRPGGVLALMCFSDRQPGDWGPRRVTADELRASFATGWTIERLTPATFEINPLPDADVVDAWLLVARRA